ncbi:MAG: HAMP domain-containing histidine kinase [Actinomycetota bacterium]|nr:HAMP domain-containing histidine kinase [Actinomycetota bacterium]
MDEGADTGKGLLLRFAAGSLGAFLLIGAGVMATTVSNVRHRAELAAHSHAAFVADAVLSPALTGIDLAAPLSGEPYARLDSIVRSRILSDGYDVRVKIWRPDGTILYSDVAAIVGQRFPDEAADLAEAIAGEPVFGVSDLTDEENVSERSIASKLLFSYVPLRSSPGGRPVAVAEVYQRYALIQGDISQLLRSLTITFAAGLLILYAALLPIARRASRELRSRNRQLREQTNQLSVLLTREQVTVEELRELNRLKDDFVAAASHELRTPLTSVLGYVRTLQRPEFGDDPATRHEFLQAAEGQGNRLFRLIRNLLSSARLERGGLAHGAVPLDIAQLAEDARASFPLESARIDLTIAPDLPPLVTDPDRITEVLTNLVDNALKYSPDGGRVELGARPQGQMVQFWVRDDGIGIDDGEVEHIFERFYQVDQTATRRFGGVGLGLYLVNELVRDLGGTVDVQSAPGGGSTFTVSLPFAGIGDREAQERETGLQPQAASGAP